METIVISWIAVFKDFIESTEYKQVNPNGPTITFHREFFKSDKYSKHVIVYSSESGKDVGMRPRQLERYLKEHFPEHNIELVNAEIEDESINNYNQLKLKIDYMLHKYKNYNIEILIGPGSRLMQMVWAIAHTTLDLHTKLIQHTPEWSIEKGEKPGLLEIKVEKNELREQLFSRKIELDQNIVGDQLLTGDLEVIYKKAYQAAQASLKGINFLILGQTGTGKELLAKYIHQNSLRKNKEFRAINCSSFSDELLGSELFGHEKGAFTGATDKRKGLFEEVNGGMIFLDEIGDISPFMQQSLLRVLEEGEIRPLGGNKTIKVDVQVISATNANLIEKCESGTFRWDLYYRLSILELELPTLQELGKKAIKDAIKRFSDQIIKENKSQFSKTEFSKETLFFLESYNYPGNFREMRNIIRGLFALNKEIITVEDLPRNLLRRKEKNSLLLSDIEKLHIERVYRLNNHNIAATARDLGLKHEHHLKKKMQLLGIIKDEL